MARVKAYQTPKVEADDEHDITTSSRRSQRQTKSRVDPQDASISEIEDLEESELVPSPSLSPVPSSKPKRKARKSNAQNTPSAPTEGDSPEPQLAKDGRRKGGNKRKWTHEYCLTCTNYGRACKGRREGEPGCAMCREPNREKGEKLRECLWADSNAGIETYEQARAHHKKTQQETRAQKAKAPKRPAQIVDLAATAGPSYENLTAPDPLGIVAHPGGGNNSRPALSRPLNLLPPSHAEAAGSPSFTNGYRPNGSLNVAQAPANNGDTIVVNTARHGRHPSHPEIPGVHPPRIIDLPNNDEPPYAPVRHVLPPPFHYFPEPIMPPGLSHLGPGFAAYYDPHQRAYVLPVYPHSNLLPPPQFNRPHAATYMSPYDADPSIPISTTAGKPPQAVFPTSLPPPNSGFPVPQPLKLRFRNPEPLDTSGTPCRKWSRTEDKVTTLSGHEFRSKGWKRGANGSGNRQQPQLPRHNGTAMSNEVDTRKTDASSELSSAIDVDESMLAATPDDTNIDEDEDMVEVVEIATQDGDEPTHDEPQVPQHRTKPIDEEETDRAQALLKQVYNETTNGKKRKRSPSPEPELAARFVAVNENYDSDGSEDATSSEGEDKPIPMGKRAPAFNAATYNNSSKSSARPEPKVKASRGNGARKSIGSSQYEDTAEEHVQVNGFAAVNPKRDLKRKSDTSLVHKRKIFAQLQHENEAMNEA